uniref:Uncharacterized protein LOC114347994 n=1 Tax=Diabrotica virgifera virgifera TaxID=50390 RepID=A0A6P7H798_DIAVI
MVNKCSSTVQHIVECYRNENRVENKSRLAPNKIFTDREERWILREIANNPKKVYQNCEVRWKGSLKKDVTPKQLDEYYEKIIYTAELLEINLISQRNMRTRLVFAREHVNKDSNF